MNYQFEKRKLLAHIGNDNIIALLKQSKCFIAGGAITSIFSGNDINDIDVYFRDYDSLIGAIKNIFQMNDDETSETFFDINSHTLIYTNHTTKSILFTKDNLNLQFIYFKFFNTAEEIFSTFDFTINMGVYDCVNGEFILHSDFLKDIAQRRLNINPNTSFPIISLLRIDKYRQRGYSISRKDFVNLCLAVNKLKIESWEELHNAIGGMYGYTYKDLFDTYKDFSIEEAINQLTKLESDMDSVAVVNTSMTCFQIINAIRETLKMSVGPESRLFYKKVLKTTDPTVFSSLHYRSFKYSLGQIVNGGEHGVWAYQTIKDAKNNYGVGNKNNEVVIELYVSECAKIIQDTNLTFKLIGDVQVIRTIEDA